MTDDERHRLRWPASTPRSATDAPSWPCSSAPATRSPATPRAATPAPPATPVPASFTSRSAAPAGSSPAAARRTVRSVQLRMFSDSMSTRSTAADGLRALRPTTRGQCLQEARPCPWASCRHHLLLTVAADRIRINAPSRGRHPSLGPRASEAAVALWVDAAVERLSLMGATCSLDVADQVAAEGVPLGKRNLGRLLGVTPAGAQHEVARAEAAAQAAAQEGES